MNASNEKYFSSFYNKAISEAKDKSNVIQHINDMNRSKNLYAAYIIDSTSGSLCQRGSTRAEQNHSSVIAFIGKESTGELHELLHKLLDRQKMHIKDINHRICVQNAKMLLTTNKLLSNSHTNILYDASKYLNHYGYEEFEKSYNLSLQYNVVIDTSGKYLVSHMIF